MWLWLLTYDLIIEQGFIGYRGTRTILSSLPWTVTKFIASTKSTNTKRIKNLLECALMNLYFTYVLTYLLTIRNKINSSNYHCYLWTFRHIQPRSRRELSKSSKIKIPAKSSPWWRILVNPGCPKSVRRTQHNCAPYTYKHFVQRYYTGWFIKNKPSV